jgi:putative PEP-CTERM system TPR-repeat lipoprotein
MPDQPQLLEAAGRVYLASGDLNQALAVYGKLASVLPNSALPMIRMAQAHLATKDKQAAARDLQKALSLQPTHLGAQVGAIALDMEGGRQKEALALAREVQKQRPTDAVGYALEADVYAAAKQWSESLAAYRRGLKETRSPYLATRLHSTLLASGQTGEAQQFAATWLKDHAKDNTFRLHVAQTAMLRKDFASATQQYRQLVEVEPNNPSLWNNLAWTSAEMKDPKAVDYAEHAVKLAPDQPAFMDTLGTLLVEKGDTSRGVELLRKAATLAPQIPEFRLSLAKAQIKAGQKDAARKELDELAKLGDKFSRQAEVKQLKQEL